MRQLFASINVRRLTGLALFIMLQTISFAFESLDSALDYVYEYSSDTLWGIKMPFGNSYKAGYIQDDVEYIVNSRELTSSILIRDTINVPKEHYVFFVTTPDNFVIEGSSPFVSYFFLSKNDSSHIVTDTLGCPTLNQTWNEIRTNGRLLQEDAIKEALSSISLYTNSSKYLVYLVEDSNDLELSAEELSLDIRVNWYFIIDTIDGTKILFYSGRNRNGSLIQQSVIPQSIVCKKDLLTISGLKMVFNNYDNKVEGSCSDIKNKVFPNPADDVIFVNMTSCIITLLSMEGKELCCTNNGWLSLLNYPAGICLLKIAEGNKITYEWVIKR